MPSYLKRRAARGRATHPPAARPANRRRVARCACGAAGMAARAERESRRERRARILADALARGEASLRRQALRWAACSEDAEDALQDACLEFLRYYDGPPGEPAVRYLMVSVRRRARVLGATAYRRHHAACVEVTTTDVLRRGESRIAVLCDRPGPAERTEREEQLRRFVDALGELKPDERTALLLPGLGCTYREIAARESWSQTKVNRSLAEGRAALRVRLEGESSSRQGLKEA